MSVEVRIAIGSTVPYPYLADFAEHLQGHPKVTIELPAKNSDEKDILCHCGNLILLDDFTTSRGAWTDVPGVILDEGVLPGQNNEETDDFSWAFYVLPEVYQDPERQDQRKRTIRELIEAGSIRYRSLPTSWEEFDKRLNEIGLYTVHWEKLGLCFNPEDSAFHVVNGADYGVSLIDERRNILFANSRRRMRHGNDILGKKCFRVFSEAKEGQPRICEGCPCHKILLGDLENNRCESHRIKDKHGHSYWISETASVVQIGSKRLAVNVVRDITIRAVASRTIPRLQQARRIDEIEKFALNASKEMGFERARLYEANFDITRHPIENLPYNFFVGRQSLGMDNASETIPDNESFVGYRVTLEDAPSLRATLIEKKPMIYDSMEIKGDPAWLMDLGLKDRQWVNLPLYAGERVVGVLSLDCKNRELKNPKFLLHITYERLLQLSEFANFLAQNLQRVRSQRSLELASRMAREAASMPQWQEPFDPLLKIICQELQVLKASLFEPDGEGKLRRTAVHFEVEGFDDRMRRFYIESPAFEEVYDVGQHIVGTVFGERKTINMINFEEYDKGVDELEKRPHWEFISNDEDFLKRQLNIDNIKIRNGLFVPLIAEGQPIGVLRVVNNLRQGRVPFPTSEKEALESVAGYLAHLLKDVRNRQRIDKAFSQITSALLPALDESGALPSMGKIARYIADAARAGALCDRACLLLVSEDGSKLEIVGCSPRKHTKETFTYPIPEVVADNHHVEPMQKTGTTVWSIINKKNLHLNTRKEIEAHESFSEEHDDVFCPRGQKCQSIALAPVLLGNRAVGVLRMEDHREKRFSPSLLDMASILANFAALAVASTRAIKKRDEYLAQLGHELGSPLVAMRGLADELQMRYLRYPAPKLSDGGKTLQGVDEANVSIPDGTPVHLIPETTLRLYATHLLQASSHMLFVLSPDRDWWDRDQYRFEKVNLWYLVREVLKILEHAARSNQLDVQEPERPEMAITIFCDKSLLAQAIYNVLWNAIKYSEKGGKVEVVLERLDGTVVIRVRDWGIGVQPELADRIFEESYRAPEARYHDPRGVGRGLSVARAIIENHGGSIEVSRYREPTEFLIELPVNHQVQARRRQT